MSRINGLGLTAGLFGPHRVAASPYALAPLRRLVPAQSRVMLILLSLNLMLLSFFIVLTASSNFDQTRIIDAVVGLRTTFAGAGRDEPSGSGTASRAEVEATLRERISGAFSSVIPAGEIQLGGGGDRIDVVVPVTALFEAPDAGLRPRLPMLDRVLELLATPPAGYRFELILASPNFGQEPNMVAAARAETVARELAARGLDSSLLAIGSDLRAASDVPSLRFSFLVLDADEDSSVRRYAGGGP